MHVNQYVIAILCCVVIYNYENNNIWFIAYVVIQKYNYIYIIYIAFSNYEKYIDKVYNLAINYRIFIV